jgi:hypothetical protein
VDECKPPMHGVSVEQDKRAVGAAAEAAALDGALHGLQSEGYADGLAAEDLLSSPEIRRQGSMERLVGGGQWESGLCVLTRSGFLHWVAASPGGDSAGGLSPIPSPPDSPSALGGNTPNTRPATPQAYPVELTESGLRLAGCHLAPPEDDSPYAMVIRDGGEGGGGGGGGGGLAGGWRQLLGGGRAGGGRVAVHTFRAPSETEYAEWALSIKEAITTASTREREARAAAGGGT